LSRTAREGSSAESLGRIGRVTSYFVWLFTNVAETLCETAGVPPLPVMLRVYVPLLVLDGTFTVSFVLVVEGLGLKLPVAPAGKPVTLKFTGAAKPPLGVIVTVYSAVPPERDSVTDDGLTESEKSGAGAGVGVTVGVGVGGGGVGVGLAPAILKLPMRVRQLKVPFAA
jgi:hypothetical protein